MKELIIDSLVKTYSNGVQALKGVNLTIKEGMFGLLGPNGAGKSTLMRTISTLQEADSGTITFDGIDVTENKMEIRKRLGFLPQDFDFYPNISAVDMLTHFARLKGIVNPRERKEVVNHYLNEVNLFNVKKKHLGSYSGGMKQRFGIAQALLGEPDLLIVDEPTAGLDPKERNHFYNILSALGENRIVILSTHIVEDVSELCSEFAIIHRGEVLLCDNPIQSINHLEGMLWKRLIDKSEIENYSDRFKVISTKLQAGQVQITVLSEELPDESFTSKEPDLSDVYFSTIPADEIV
ncbi:MAG: ABC transporter ATP-binding protein [Candidatus Cloacimonetes bacterium]|nr:ABC transporter ATP-binding protein [Candidatus Cloacimonadota bacterium]